MSLPEPPLEKVRVFACQPRALVEPASQRGFSSQLGLVEPGAGGKLRHSPMQP